MSVGQIFLKVDVSEFQEREAGDRLVRVPGAGKKQDFLRSIPPPLTPHPTQNLTERRGT